MPRRMGSSEKYRRLTAFALRITGEVGGLIAVPAIVFTSAARWADARLGTAHRLYILALFLAFFTTMVAVSFKAASYADAYEELTDDKDRGPPPPGDAPP